jgi:surface protein
MIYKISENRKEINILSKTFVRNNIKRTKIILDNKQYNLKQNIESKKKDFKMKIIFLDNIIKLNSMFFCCKSLSSVHNFHNLNTKYLKTIDELFFGCSSLLHIDNISNWNINKNEV